MSTTSFPSLDANELGAVTGGKSSSDTRLLQALNGVTSAAKSLIPGGAGPATLAAVLPGASTTPTTAASTTSSSSTGPSKPISLPVIGTIGG